MVAMGILNGNQEQIVGGHLTSSEIPFSDNHKAI